MLHPHELVSFRPTGRQAPRYRAYGLSSLHQIPQLRARLSPEDAPALLAAARAAGLGEREALATIHSGLRAGVRRPHRLEGRFRKGGAA